MLSYFADLGVWDHRHWIRIEISSRIQVSMPRDLLSKAVSGEVLTVFQALKAVEGTTANVEIVTDCQLVYDMWHKGPIATNMSPHAYIWDQICKEDISPSNAWYFAFSIFIYSSEIISM